MNDKSKSLSEILTGKLNVLANALEHEGHDDLSFQVSVLAREVRMAATEDVIEVSSWEDFRNFFVKNLGPDLMYRVADQFGADDPKTKELGELVKLFTEAEQRLNAFYLKVKGQPDPQASQAAPPEEALSSLEDEPAAEPAAE